MLHVGVHVKSPEDQDKFYKDILGFRFLWQGGLDDDRLDWISYLTPDGNNWVEYMVQHEGPRLRRNNSACGITSASELSIFSPSIKR